MTIEGVAALLLAALAVALHVWDRIEIVRQAKRLAQDEEQLAIDEKELHAQGELLVKIEEEGLNAAVTTTGTAAHGPQGPFLPDDWTAITRASGLLEWECPHGCGHPAPEEYQDPEVTKQEGWGVHGCCHERCCDRFTFCQQDKDTLAHALLTRTKPSKRLKKAAKRYKKRVKA